MNEDRSVSREQDRARLALVGLRVVVACLIAAHGWARLLSDAVVPFGGWLDEQGLPFGLGLAAAVTAFEICGTPLLALGKFRLPLTLTYAAIYLTGIVLVHAPEGWFVVGLGRNGMEYSVLLVTCLLCVGFTAPYRTRR